MNEQIDQTTEIGLILFKAREPLTGAEWADKYFYLSAESSGIEGKWETLPYQIGPINWMTDDDIEEFNWIKSARMGYTKCLLIAIGYGVEQKRRNIALWQPTDGDAKDFCTDEIDTMLRDVEVVGNLLKCRVGSKSKYNTNEKKSFHGATLDIKGGKSGRNYRRMTKDVVIYDETDGFDIDVDGEGSPFSLGDTRTQTSSFPKSIRGSTPRIKGMSMIESAVDQCELIFHRYLPCPSCGVMQRLEFAHLRVKGEEKGWYICKHNGCVLTYSMYPAMDKGGRWQTVDGTYYDEQRDIFFGPDDEPIDRPKRIACRIWAAYSYFTTWEDTADKWIEAVQKSKYGDKTALKTVINTRLGETYEDRGESIKSKSLTDRLEDYTPDRMPKDVLLLTFGADVQGGKNPRIECEIVGHGLEGETWSIDYLSIAGDPEQQAVWDHLDEELLKTFTREDGVPLTIAGGFIDSGYLPSRVYKFTSTRRSRNIYATKGVTAGQLCNAGTWQGDKRSARAILHTCNVDEAKELIFGRLRKVDTPGPGYCHFPEHYDQHYFDMLTNEQKKEKRKAGQLIGYKWVKKNTFLGNEPLDCRAYALSCLSRLNPNLPKMKMRLDQYRERVSVGLPTPSQTSRPQRRIRSHGVQ